LPYQTIFQSICFELIILNNADFAELLRSGREQPGMSPSPQPAIPPPSPFPSGNTPVSPLILLDLPHILLTFSFCCKNKMQTKYKLNANKKAKEGQRKGRCKMEPFGRH
jgi:hypothetical protein